MNFIALAVGAVSGALVWALIVTHRLRRRVDYLRPLAGDRDYWDVLCHHCRKPMRDAHSMANTHPGPAPNTTVRAVFHMDRPACAAAASEHARSGAA